MGKLFGNNDSFDASIDQGCLMSHQPMIWHDIMELLLTCQCVLNSKFEHLGIFRQAAVRPQPTTIENKEVIFDCRPTRMLVEKKKSFPFLDRLVCLSRKRNRARSNHLVEDLSTERLVT